jgi:hypothetical protein
MAFIVPREGIDEGRKESVKAKHQKMAWPFKDDPKSNLEERVNELLNSKCQASMQGFSKASQLYESNEKKGEGASFSQVLPA